MALVPNRCGQTVREAADRKRGCQLRLADLDYGVMNLNFALKSFSTYELLAGSAALALVALIALFGLRVPQPQDLLPAVPSSLSTASLLSSQSVSWVSGEQFSERSQEAGIARKSRPTDPGSERDNRNLPESDGPTATGSPAADGARIAPTRRVGQSLRDDEVGDEQRLVEKGLLWKFAAGIQTTEPRDTQCGFVSADAAGTHEAWDRPRPKSIATSCGQNSAEGQTEPSARERTAEAAFAPTTPLEQNPLSRRGGRDDAFVGSWADDADECREYQNRGAPLAISTHAAKTADGKCDFQSIRREAGSRWRVVAQCLREGETWTAHVELALAGVNLIWSSERGVAKYVRCPRS